MTLSELETAFDALPVQEKAQFAAYASFQVRADAAFEQLTGGEPLTLGELFKRWKPGSFDEDFANDLEKVNAADTPMENPWAL